MSATTPAIGGLEGLLARLRIADWDILLVGDGSGSSWPHMMGWGTISVERATGAVKRWCGAANHGTSNVAEIMAYIHPLAYFAEDPERHAALGRLRPLRVHIVTDSQYCRDTGRRRGQGAKRNLALWTALSAFERQGLVLYWHWIPRDSHPANQHVDELSKFCRKLLEAYNPLEHAQSVHGL